MAYTGSNLCNQAATVLPTCEDCKGDGMLYPLVKKDCLLCEGKKEICIECGATGYVYVIEPTKCETCLGSGQLFHIALARG